MLLRFYRISARYCKQDNDHKFVGMCQEICHPKNVDQFSVKVWILKHKIQFKSVLCFNQIQSVSIWITGFFFISKRQITVYTLNATSVWAPSLNFHLLLATIHVKISQARLWQRTRLQPIWNSRRYFIHVMIRSKIIYCNNRTFLNSRYWYSQLLKHIFTR